MRNLIVSLILSPILAMGTAAHAEDTWFRLNASATILFSGMSESPPDDSPDGDLDILVDTSAAGRVYGEISLPVVVSGLGATDTMNVTGLPSGAMWTPESHGVGTILWPGAVEGFHEMTIEVHNESGELAAQQAIELVIHPELTASVPKTIYEAEVGGELTIVPSVQNTIGEVLWGSTPSPLPDWLSLEDGTGEIAVDTSETNELPSVTLTAVDQFDKLLAMTTPFAIAVNGAATDYWVATLGGTSTEEGHGIAVGSDGSIYVTGNARTGTGKYDLLVAKFSASGALVWKKTIGGGMDEYGKGIAVGPNGSVYAVGYTASVGAGGYDLLVAKFSESGTLDWKATLGGTSNDYGYDITVSADGSIYVTGSAKNANADAGDLLVGKYSSSGTLEWSKTLGGEKHDLGYGIAVGSDNSLYVTGRTDRASEGGNDLLVAKYSTTGTLEWSKTLGDGSADYSHDITVSSDGFVYVTGYTYSFGAAGYDLVAAKYSSSGTLQWKKTLGGESTQWGQGIAAGSNGSVYVVGRTYSVSAGDFDLLVAKYSASGTLDWTKTLGGTSDDIGQSIAVSADGTVYVTGSTESAGEGDADLLVARLSSDDEPTVTGDPFTFQDIVMTDGTAGDLTETAPAWSSPNADLIEDSGSGLTEGTATELADSLIELQSAN